MIIDSKDQKQSLFHYFIKGEAAKRVYDVIATSFGLLNSFLVITYLSVFHFGLYQLVLSFVAILESFNVGLLETIVVVEMRRAFNIGRREIAKRLFLEHTVAKLALALIITALIFFSANLIAERYSENIGLFIKIASALVLIRSLQSLETTFFQSVVAWTHWSFPSIREIVKLGLLLVFLAQPPFTILDVLLAHVGGELLALLSVSIFGFIRRYRRAFQAVAFAKEFLLARLIKERGWWVLVRYGFSKITKNTMPWFIKFFINTEAVAFYALSINLVSFVESVMPLTTIGPIFMLKADQRETLSFIFKRSAKYVFWLGVLVAAVAVLAVPPLLVFLFPKYLPAVPLVYLLLLALPLYGVYKLLKIILSVLREDRILAFRVINEVLVIPIGAVICLPLFGLVGAGFVYLATYLERVWFFYGQLVKKYPDFRVKPRMLFSIDDTDRQYFIKTLERGRNFFKRVF